MSGRPAGFVLVAEVGWAAATIATTCAALGPGRSMLGRPRAVLLCVALATPPTLYAWLVIWSAQFPESLNAAPGRPGFVCFDYVLAMALWPLIAFALARRATDPVHPRSAGAVAGVAAGAWAGALLNLSCEISNPAHVALGHVLPVLLLSGVGVLVGRPGTSRSWRCSSSAVGGLKRTPTR